MTYLVNRIKLQIEKYRQVKLIGNVNYDQCAKYHRNILRTEFVHFARNSQQCDSGYVTENFYDTFYSIQY